MSPNELNTTLTPHSIIPGDACFAYFNKNWGIPVVNRTGPGLGLDRPKQEERLSRRQRDNNELATWALPLVDCWFSKPAAVSCPALVAR